MATGSAIEWTEATWNPVVGCSKVSAGCTNCYAERMAHRLAAMAISAADRGSNPGRLLNYRSVLDARGRWNGTIHLDAGAVEEPFRWKKPRVVFVNSMSDLFHEGVSPLFLRRVFETMNNCPRHTFQILTKRPERAASVAGQLTWTPNIWIGTSVELARHMDRARLLRCIPTRIRFLSVEPLLGPIRRLPLAGIRWVIVGGESGPGARPMRPDWVRQIRDRCRERGVAFFFKQWGGVNKKTTGRVLDGQTWDEMPGSLLPEGR